MKVAIYGICKNEEKQLASFFDHPGLKEADNVFLSDTGSTDGTLQHYRSPWIKRISVEPFRFDVARNAALALVPPEFDMVISLDLDERLRPGWRKPLESAFAQGATRVWANYHSDGLAPFLHDSRIHARHGYRWVDPCHECIKPWMTNEVQALGESIWIDHHPDKSKPRTQYLGLLAHGIMEEPWNTRRMFYYARELMVWQHFPQAVGWFEKYLEIFNSTLDKSAYFEGEVLQAGAMLLICKGALQELQEGRQPAATPDATSVS